MNICYEGDDLESLAGLHNYQAWIMHYFRSHLRGRVLEVGAGMGAFSELLLPYVEQLDLIEPDKRLTTILQDKFHDNHAVEVTSSTVEEHFAHSKFKLYDAIIMINVLEHIEDDLNTLIACRHRLKPDGVLLQFVPAMPFLFSEIDRLLGHYRRYTKPSLAMVLKQAGFTLHTIRYFDLLGVVPWFFVNKIGGATRFNPTLAQLYDKVGIPFTRTVEALIPPPVGKNVIAIGTLK
ncbi:class I SAM-dependent methyltransferase [Magnetococcales bacterium HHB-1]